MEATLTLKYDREAEILCIKRCKVGHKAGAIQAGAYVLIGAPVRGSTEEERLMWQGGSRSAE